MLTTLLRNSLRSYSVFYVPGCILEGSKLGTVSYYDQYQQPRQQDINCNPDGSNIYLSYTPLGGSQITYRSNPPTNPQSKSVTHDPTKNRLKVDLTFAAGQEVPTLSIMEDVYPAPK